MNVPSVGLIGTSLAEERGFMDLTSLYLKPYLYQWHVLVPLLAGRRGAACDQGP